LDAAERGEVPTKCTFGCGPEGRSGTMVVTLAGPISQALREREKIIGTIVMCLGTK